MAVMTSSTSAAKIALIESQGGRCHFVAEASQVYAESERLAEETGGHYLDQFTNAERLARQQQHRRVDLRADA